VEHPQPDWWDEERFRGDSQPVIGVSWYEAAAFAAWLNHHLASDLPPGSAIRLPTEAEWEAAAAYDAAGRRRTYPWGNEPEPTRDLADFDDGSDPDRPAPVGEHPAGAAACGAQEMVGSVWEAASSSYRAYPAGSGALVEDFQKNRADVPYRGGAWANDRTYVCCGSRYRFDPNVRLVDWGFRLFLPSNVRSGVLDSES
jgi:formylglycine-generating enzyme required for sulfatase activity